MRARQSELALESAGPKVTAAAGSEAKGSRLSIRQEHDGAASEAVCSALQLEDGRSTGRIRVDVAEGEIDAELDAVAVREKRAFFVTGLAADEHALSAERDNRPSDSAAKGELANQPRVLTSNVRKKRKVDARAASVTDHKFVCSYNEVVPQLIDGEDKSL